jgi:hypothetical protein
MTEYYTNCQHCGSDAGAARLEVVTTTSTYTGVRLHHWGFAPSDAELVSTAAEQVYCAVCDTTHPLTDYVVGFPWTLKAGDDVEYDIGGGPVQITIEEIVFLRPSEPSSLVWLKEAGQDGFNLSVDQLTEVV